MRSPLVPTSSICEDPPLRMPGLGRCRCIDVGLRVTYVCLPANKTVVTGTPT